MAGKASGSCAILGAVTWIENVIAERGGEVSFCDFMEIALYHPEHGYYSASTPRWGRAGDFLTAPTASSWYVATLGHFLGKISDTVGRVEVVDIASGDGTFLATLLECCKKQVRSPVASVVSVERSETMREAQQERLAEYTGGLERCEIAPSIQDVTTSGCPCVLHASELYDAFPVHRVIMRDGKLSEFFVRLGKDGLEWAELECEPSLGDYLQRHEVLLAEGQVAEINLSAESFHRDLLQFCGGSAVAIVLDYGYEARRLYNSRGRFGGSLACYSRHQLSRDPLADPGGLDITAHVNWDDLHAAGKAEGWQPTGLWSLTEFLARAGIAEVAENEGLGIEAELDADTLIRRQELKRILDPEGMGVDLRVLVQGVGKVGSVVGEALSGGMFGAG
ncbi:MAG: hypothetical protein GY906_32785 [bacterium]|nr:hypothetical protein [bacterium]